MFNSFFHRRGESLTETMVSLSILGVGVAGALGLIFFALNSVNMLKDKVVAINLAREGIESVRAMRDTNWLKYSSNQRECWNWNEKNGDCTSHLSDGTFNNQLIQPGYYRPVLSDTDYHWKIESTGTTPEQWTSFYDINLTGTGGGLYVYAGTAGTYKTIFQRRVFLRYLNDSGVFNSSAAPDKQENILEVTSSVRYTQGGKVAVTTLVTRLSDYLDRTSHAD
jgi:type II secretory pathway pseudopilin PulG